MMPISRLPRPLRIAVLGCWHVHATDYATQVINHPDTELVAIWDNDPERGQREAAARHVPYIPDLDTVLADPHIDGVIVTTATVDHPAVLLKAAQSGKAIFTEKVVALSQSDCQHVLQAVDAANAILVVSLPRLSLPFVQGTQALIDSGLLGKLTMVRARLSHSGALPTAINPLGYLPAGFFRLSESGGGALVDLGCHPLYVVRLLLGMPQHLYAAYGYCTGKEVEDNAVVTLQYPNGAIGVVEAGFVNRSSPFTLEMHGTEGSAIYSAKDGILSYKSALLAGEQAKQWHPYELPPALPTPFEQWITHIHEDTRANDNLALALDLTRLTEAATSSAHSRQAVALT